MNRTKVENEDIAVFENETLRSVDFSKIYDLSRDEERTSGASAWAERRDLRLMTREPAADLSGLFKPLLAGLLERSELPVLRTSLSLVRIPKPSAALNLPPLVSDEHRESRKKADINLGELPEKQTYAVQASPDVLPSGNTTGQIEMELPFGMPRFLNVRTLKAMLGASTRDPMFRKVGERWEVCANSFEVDLKDRSQVFRLGKLQIFS